MWEIQLVVIGPKVGKQVKAFVQSAVGFCIGFVDLVENHDGAQAQFQRLGCDEFGLRHRAFGSVNKKDNTVHHGQDPLNLASEIGVAGGINDVDPGAFPFQRSGFGENGDTTFTFKVIGIHRPFGHGLIGAEGARLLEQFVNQCGLAVVNVGDNGDISQVHRCLFLGSRPAYTASAEKARDNAAR